MDGSSGGEFSKTLNDIVGQKSGLNGLEAKRKFRTMVRESQQHAAGVDKRGKVTTKPLTELGQENMIASIFKQKDFERKLKNPLMVEIHDEAITLLKERYKTGDPKAEKELRPPFEEKLIAIVYGKAAQAELNRSKGGPPLTEEAKQELINLEMAGIAAVENNKKEFGKISKGIINPNKLNKDGMFDGFFSEYEMAQAMATVAEKKLLAALKTGQDVMKGTDPKAKALLAGQTAELAAVAKGCQEQAMRKLVSLSRETSLHKWGKEAASQMDEFLKKEHDQTYGEKVKMEELKKEPTQEELEKLLFDVQNEHRLGARDEKSVKWLQEALGIKRVYDEKGDLQFKVAENSLAWAAVMIGRMKEMPTKTFEENMKKADEEDYDHVLAAHEAIFQSAEYDNLKRELDASLTVAVAYVEARRRLGEALMEGLKEVAEKAKLLAARGVKFLATKGVATVSHVTASLGAAFKKLTVK